MQGQVENVKTFFNFSVYSTYLKPATKAVVEQVVLHCRAGFDRYKAKLWRKKMELVSPRLIIEEKDEIAGNDRMLSYEQFKKMKPVRVDNRLRILGDADNLDLFKEYVANKYKLISVVRSNPYFKPKADFPSRVLLEMTSRCNLNCTMCPRQHLLRDVIDMEPALFKKCVDELDGMGIDGIWIYNIGESILHPSFPELLDYVSLKQSLGPIWLSSNGNELNTYFADLIINSKITFMNLSINATTPETYHRISPTGNWHSMIENCRSFMVMKKSRNKREPFSRVQIIDQEYARDEIDDFFRLLADDADIIATNMLEAFSKDVETNITYAEKRSRPSNKSCNRINRQDMFIFSNGETTFCDTDFNGRFSMGNVTGKSIYEIWNSDFRKNIMELNKMGRLNEIDLCKSCMDFDL